MKKILNFLNCKGFLMSLKIFKGWNVETISPYKSWLFVWKLFMIFYNHLFMLCLSFIIVFSATKESKHIENYILGFTFYIWVLEIFLKLNTATFYKTHLFNSRLQVFNLYVKNQLVFDVIPLVLLASPNDRSISNLFLFRVPIFFKVINIYKDKQNMEKYLMMILDNFFYIQLINFIANLFLIGHVIAYNWYIVSIIDQNYLNNEDSLTKSSISKDGMWWELYLNAFYWSFT
ncbi:hypothetical protein ABPG72_005622 [Tetrahymena utriculariae]